MICSPGNPRMLPGCSPDDPRLVGGRWADGGRGGGETGGGVVEIRGIFVYLRGVLIERL